MEGHSFRDYAASLKKQGKNTPQKFEATLAYAKFPDLDNLNGLRGSVTDHDDVNTVLDWLKNDKEVKKIVELNVQDEWENPYEEEHIAHWVREFQVERLSWRRKDLSVAALAGAFPPSETLPIRVLHLHSSGFPVALDQWFSPITFARFSKVSTIKDP
jgi:hypothetical protein